MATTRRPARKRAATSVDVDGPEEQATAADLPVPLAFENDVDIAEEIRVRAYELYLARGGAPGSEMDDWCEAEREVLARRAPERAAPGPRPSADEAVPPA
jgi:hypothetical protein